MSNNIEEKMSIYKKEYEENHMSEENLALFKAKIEQAKLDKRRKKRNANIRNWSAVAAAVVLLVLIPNVSATAANAMETIPVLGNLIRIVTFRDYSYSDSNNTANVKVPEVVVDTNEITNPVVKENVIKSSAQINEKINDLSQKWIDEFEKNKLAEGYSNLEIKSEVLRTTDKYFTLKLICYEENASGYEEHHFYTIDLDTGKELALADIFWENVDYIDYINSEIKAQMEEQMANDENIVYWLNSDIPEDNFKSITDETEFYINEVGNLVISFNEAEVAPSYMGCVEFEIYINDIKKTSAGVKAIGINSKEQSFTSYEDVIESLDAGMWYAYITLNTAKNPMLLVTDGTFDNGDGNMATIYADLYAYDEYGRIIKYGEVLSSGTAYPLAISSDYIYLAGNHHVTKMYIDEEYSSFITKEDAVEVFDTDANVTYYYYSQDESFSGKVSDDSKLVSLFEELNDLQVIGFTQK